MRILLGLAVASAIGFTAVAAQAASVSFSQFFPGGNNVSDVNEAPKNFASTDWNGTTQSVTLPQFDASLGTLTSIGLSLYGNINSTGSVTNTGLSDADVTLFAATIRIRILPVGTAVPADSDSPALLQVAPELVTLTDIDIEGGASRSFGPVDTFAAASTNITGSFAPYIGNDSLLFPLFAGTNTVSSVSGGNLVVAQTTSARALVTITYNFDEVQVPEPASLALLGMGLFGAGLLRRRRA